MLYSSRIEYFSTEFKNDLDIIFKPLKKFTKKHLKGVDITTLFDKSVERHDSYERGTHTFQDKRKVTERNFGNDDEFVNWFAVDEKPSESKKDEKKIITLKKSDGMIVGLDAMEDVF